MLRRYSQASGLDGEDKKQENRGLVTIDTAAGRVAFNPEAIATIEEVK